MVAVLLADYLAFLLPGLLVSVGLENLSRGRFVSLVVVVSALTASVTFLVAHDDVDSAGSRFWIWALLSLAALGFAVVRVWRNPARLKGLPSKLAWLIGALMLTILLRHILDVGNLALTSDAIQTYLAGAAVRQDYFFEINGFSWIKRGFALPAILAAGNFEPLLAVVPLAFLSGVMLVLDEPLSASISKPLNLRKRTWIVLSALLTMPIVWIFFGYLDSTVFVGLSIYLVVTMQNRPVQATRNWAIVMESVLIFSFVGLLRPDALLLVLLSLLIPREGRLDSRFYGILWSSAAGLITQGLWLSSIGSEISFLPLCYVPIIALIGLIRSRSSDAKILRVGGAILGFIIFFLLTFGGLAHHFIRFMANIFGGYGGWGLFPHVFLFAALMVNSFGYRSARSRIPIFIGLFSLFFFVLKLSDGLIGGGFTLDSLSSARLGWSDSVNRMMFSIYFLALGSFLNLYGEITEGFRHSLASRQSGASAAGRDFQINRRVLCFLWPRGQ